ncbi:prevent-host-death family protein [Cyanobacterium stanieri PCC 7202]|uniref:Antitoxin n=1 Tax=Cyanobacterium stanieri (strain ATCC 29140 / PCC 7202) TaxID=292563 RepID=K9YPC1_CYASC|nr:prevent-host-death family protein [Cyanobacterium stanieri PCC 7202]
MKVVTSNQAKQELDQLMDQVISDIEPTIVCNDQGKQVIMMSLEEFNSWQETIYLLSNPANAQHLMESIKQAESGNKFTKELID